MSGNSSISAKTIPEGVNEAAVMESLAECKYIAGFYKDSGYGKTLGDFMAYCEKQGGANDPQVQIVRDYLSTHVQARSYEVLDVSPGYKVVGNKILICGQQVDGTRSYYVGFQGTQSDEWYDNGEGMAQKSTLQQRDAAQYFDDMVEKKHITAQDTVIVTGHSKGGNKAQYVTMASEHADLIDTCIALDGQGFSPEAVEQWKQYPDVYERRQKIILIAGENDYVHVLGERIATDENTYYISYDPAYADQEGLSAGEIFKSYHYNQYLFQTVWDNEKQCYVFSSELQTPSTQGILSQQVQDINDYLMTLPPEERLAASVTFMSFLGEGSVDGYTPTLTDIISTLNTLYELLDYKLGTWDDAMLARYAPKTYATLETIHALIRGLENIRNKWEQVRTERAKSRALALASSDPYIYIDTVVWDQLGSTMRTLGSTNFSAIRLELIDIRNQLLDIFSSVGNVIRAAWDAYAAVQRTMYEAEQAITDFSMGNVIGGIYNTVEAAVAGFNAAQKIAKSLWTTIQEAQNIYNSLSTAVSKISSAVTLLGTEDTVRKLGNYLADTAQDFQLAESQNIALVQKWGGV